MGNRIDDKPVRTDYWRRAQRPPRVEDRFVRPHRAVLCSFDRDNVRRRVDRACVGRTRGGSVKLLERERDYRARQLRLIVRDLVRGRHIEPPIERGPRIELDAADGQDVRRRVIGAIELGRPDVVLNVEREYATIPDLSICDLIMPSRARA